MKKIGVIGLGYVGLPLAIASSRKYSVIGYDNNLWRIKQLQKNIDSNEEFSKNELIKIKNIHYTNKIKELEDCNIKIITVPTPIKKNKKLHKIPLVKQSRLSVMPLTTKEFNEILKLSNINE